MARAPGWAAFDSPIADALHSGTYVPWGSLLVAWPCCTDERTDWVAAVLPRTSQPDAVYWLPRHGTGHDNKVRRVLHAVDNPAETPPDWVREYHSDRLVPTASIQSTGFT